MHVDRQNKYALGIQIPWLDAGEVNVVRLLRKLIEMLENELWDGEWSRTPRPV